MAWGRVENGVGRIEVESSLETERIWGRYGILVVGAEMEQKRKERKRLAGGAKPKSFMSTQ